MAIQESGEMYLETILILSEKYEHVRSINISEYMGYSKPSVSRAIGILKNNNYIDINKNGYISLTEKGKLIAETIYERHRVISGILIQLGVDENTAAEDACKIEHVISDTSMRAIKKHIAENEDFGG